MKITYSVANLRRLTSMPEVELRPITILLGKNSVGKSTFLRSFPLLRQSIETKSSAPVLWYGDYADFGNFRGAVTNNEENRSIKFSFKIGSFSSTIYTSEVYSPSLGGTRSQSRQVSYDEITAIYNVQNSSGSTVRDTISLKIPSMNSELSIGFGESKTFANSLVLDEEELKPRFADINIFFPQGNLFTTPSFFRSTKDGKLTPETKQSVFLRAIQRELDGFIDGRISRATVAYEAIRILQKNNIDDEALSGLQAAQTKTFRDIYQNMRNGRTEAYSRLRKRLNSICLLNSFFITLEAVNQSLSNYFGSVEYIGPARARSERFYRQQELEVSEISPDGRNLPMFLASLSEAKLHQFSAWVERMFDYGVSVRKTEGHISINLEQAGKSVNVVDTGYGVSQVLPVLAQIWWMQHGTRNRRFIPPRSSNRKLLAIEQPELHLHPAHQALLADVFVEALSSRTTSGTDVNLSFLIETHSESIVNRLGELIAAGQIGAGDVQIVIFGDSKEDSGQSAIQLSTYGHDGVLQNWPYGFFNY